MTELGEYALAVRNVYRKAQCLKKKNLADVPHAKIGIKKLPARLAHGISVGVQSGLLAKTIARGRK